MGALESLRMGNVVAMGIDNPMRKQLGIVTEVDSHMVNVFWPDGTVERLRQGSLELQFDTTAQMYELLNNAAMAAERSRQKYAESSRLTAAQDEEYRKRLGADLWQLGVDHNIRNQMESIMGEFDIPTPPRRVRATVTLTFTVEGTAKDGVTDPLDSSYFDSSLELGDNLVTLDKSWHDAEIDLRDVVIGRIESVVE